MTATPTDGERATDEPASVPAADVSTAEPDEVHLGYIAGLVGRGRELAGRGQARADELLAEHADQPLIDVGLRIYKRDRESAGTVVGSAVAFRLFLFFVPLLLFLVGVLGFLASYVESVDVNEHTGVTGSLAEQIKFALNQPGSSRWFATITGLFGMFWAGRSLSKVMVSASCLAWRLPMQAKASVKVVGGIVGLVSGIGLIAVLVNRIRGEFGVAVAGFSFIAAFVVYGVAWLLLSMLLPRATRDPGALLPGAVLVGLTIASLQALSQLYLPDRLGRASELYGAIGTTIVTLGWFFIFGRAMVLAMAFNAVIHERFGSISQFVFALPVLRVLPRKSAFVRRFFDLEA